MLKVFLLILLSLLLSIGLFELFLRYSPFSYGLSPVLYDKDIGMWHKKNFSSYAISECYKNKYIFDADGLVQLNYKYNKNIKDILLLGDSFTEAIMVKNKNILHNSLWKIYKDQFNFINYGLSGTSPIEQFVILTKKSNLKNVKMVLQIINIDSDIYDVNPNSINSLGRPKVSMKFLNKDKYSIFFPRELNIKDKLMDILGDYQLYIPLKKIIYLVKDQVKDFLMTKEKLKDRISLKEENLSTNWTQIEGAIYQTKVFLNKKNITYKILINSYKKNNIISLSNILKKYSIPFLDLNTVAKSYNMNLSTFSCDRHWDDNAHINIAKIIYKTNFIGKE